jgi:hypothetical protein
VAPQKKGHSLIDGPNIETHNRNMQQKYRKSKYVVLYLVPIGELLRGLWLQINISGPPHW